MTEIERHPYRTIIKPDKNRLVIIPPKTNNKKQQAMKQASRKNGVKATGNYVRRINLDCYDTRNSNIPARFTGWLLMLSFFVFLLGLASLFANGFRPSVAWWAIASLIVSFSCLMLFSLFASKSEELRDKKEDNSHEE